MVDHKKRESSKTDLKNLAISFRVKDSQLDKVLYDWSYEDLIEHLQKFTAEELKPPSMTGRF